MSDVLVKLITELPPERRAYLAELLRPAAEPIAIVGMACRFPGGVSTPDAFWRLLRDGVDAIGAFPEHRLGSGVLQGMSPVSPARWGGFLAEVDQFDASFFGIARREAEMMDPRQRLLLETGWEAIEDAGYAPSGLAGSQTGIFVGMSSAGSEYAGLGLDVTDPTAITGNYPSVASGRLSYLLGVHGPSLVVDTACSAALAAIHLACQSLRQNECSLALVGGVNLILSPLPTMAMEQSLAMASDGRCKSFDARADGFVRGEGCGVVVLKRLSHALACGDTIRAVIRGSAVNQDGRSSSLTAPNGVAQQAVIRAALAQACVEPRRVSYVEAHGTATALGDPIELEALGAVLGEGRAPGNRVAIGSVKTNIGHLEAAAGIAGLLKVVLSLQHQEIPPHLHFREPNPLVPWADLPLTVPTSLTPWPANGAPHLAGLSSFGFSGTNAHLIVEEAPP
ncbi:MAG TPA: polyketide synthase, partial [Chloroflexota bacterium]|nr:polyketide synthase [Chloroflexota bacterium]